MTYNPEDPLQRSKAIYGDSAATKPLPFFRKFNLPPAPEEIPVNPGIIAESCGGKIISGAAIGNGVTFCFNGHIYQQVESLGSVWGYLWVPWEGIVQARFKYGKEKKFHKLHFESN